MCNRPLTDSTLSRLSPLGARQFLFALLVPVVFSTGCGNLFQSMVAKYGPTTDEQGANELAALAEAGREQLSRGDYLPAVESAPKIWAGLSSSDSRKGGIATLYFREFCDALYATDGKLPAFEVASLLQLAAEGFPSKTWKEDFVKSDRERLLKMSAAANQRARPELEGLAAQAAKRGHNATELLYLAQVVRMVGTDPAAKAQRDAALGRLQAARKLTFAVTGHADLAKRVATVGNRPANRVEGKAQLQAEVALSPPNYEKTTEVIQLTASVVRGKKEVPNPDYKTLERQAEGSENVAKRMRNSSRPADQNTADSAHKSALAYRAKLAKTSPTMMVDNVEQATYPGVRKSLTGSQTLSGKILIDNDKSAAPLHVVVTAGTSVVSHDGFAEARIAPQRGELPPDASINGALLARAEAEATRALVSAFDRRTLASVAELEKGSDHDKVEAAAVLIVLTELGDADKRAKLISGLTRLPYALKLLRP
jgi:hypothetical protein